MILALRAFVDGPDGTKRHSNHTLNAPWCATSGYLGRSVTPMCAHRNPTRGAYHIQTAPLESRRLHANRIAQR